MSKTTFQIGASLQATFPKHKITHLRNFEVNAEGDYAEAQIAGVFVRWSANADEVKWCYI